MNLERLFFDLYKAHVEAGVGIRLELELRQS